MSDLHPVGRCLDGAGERPLDPEQLFAAAKEESLHPRQFAALQRRHHALERPQVELPPPGEPRREPGGNCIKIGLSGKLILSKRKGLWEVILS